jgi:excinuclease ABC subunit C
MEKFKFLKRKGIKKLPKKPGVYCFKNKEILYIGKAVNLRERVKNHFPSHSEGERRTNVLRTQQPGFKDYLFLSKVKKVGYIKTNSEIEALILEANLIKKYQPKYNVIWKDDKNYFFVGITKDYNPPTTLPPKGRVPDFPRIFITHQPKLQTTNYKLQTEFLGPFIDGKALKQTLKILRKVFPYRSCKNLPKRPCLWYHLGRCPAPCQIKTKLEEKILFNQIKRECQKNAENVFQIFQGKKPQVLKNLKKEMKEVSRLQDFERAAKIRDQILAFGKILTHTRLPGLRPDEVGQEKIFNWPEIQKILQEILGIKKEISKIEAYDVSNIQGQLATGAMVTFIKGKPAKDFYRRFKISGKFTPYRTRSGAGPNDIAMIKEILSRRVNHPEWPYPDLMLIDGGKAQLNAALDILNQQKSVKSALISVLALAKRKNELFIGGQKNPILLKNLPREIFNLILQLRDEAHRFAISYHKKLREKELFGIGLTFN